MNAGQKQKIRANPENPRPNFHSLLCTFAWETALKIANCELRISLPPATCNLPFSFFDDCHYFTFDFVFGSAMGAGGILPIDCQALSTLADPATDAGGVAEDERMGRDIFGDD